MIMSWRRKTYLSPTCLINCEASAVTVTGRFAQLEVEKQAESHEKKVEKGAILGLFLFNAFNRLQRERQTERAEAEESRHSFYEGCLQHSDASSYSCTQMNFKPA